MSCTICHGHPNCPCCEKEPKMITCPDCNGEGKVYYVGDCIVTKQIYDTVLALVPKACDYLLCELCHGKGKVEEEEYEPDPDERYDSRND